MPTKKRKSSTRKSKRGQSGRGFKEILGKIHRFVKDNKVISRGLRLTPYSGVANAAAMLGYGRKKRKSRTSRRLSVRRLVMPSLTTLPKRSRRNPVKTRARVAGRAVMVPSGVTLLRRAGGQTGRGIFGDIGGGVGSVFRGLFG